MKIVKIAFVFSWLILTGCANEENKNSANTAAPPLNINVNINQAAPAAEQKTPGGGRDLEKLNKDIFSRNSQTAPAKNAANVKIQGNATLNSSAAPDDSEFHSTINAQGQPVEVRTFKNHPQLLKAERTYLTPDRKIIKVYFKNGRTVELNDEQIPNFPAASAISILNAAGTDANKQK